ncbi:hypothetical protein [Nonomuraea sp. SYSU D8015]|uniref:hypothetical protein n=1 Tax=Nonomuraea sp. SYSU D8015 TaxID=2593644 RepID=UPI00166173D5|nr:hypothetical protein [Nonomuraea sp. SYSU D8015]
MPMEDVGRLLDTLDEGYAEATGEQPAVPAHDPGTEVIPGTGQYQRPPQPDHLQQQPHHQQPLDDRPTAALSPNDVLVARGPAPQDKLVASFGETTAPRDANPAYGERPPFTGPQYVDPTGPQPQYTGDPFSGPQYTGDAPQYQQQPDPFGNSQYADNEPVYQMPGADQRRPSPVSTDPLGFPSQAASPYAASQAADSYAAPQHRSDPFPADPYPSDPYASASDPFGRRQEAPAPAYAQPQPSQGGGAGLGTPMHGIPGAGRRRAAPQQPAMDDYAAYQQPQQANPVDPLLALGRQEQQYQPHQQQPDPNTPRPYAGDPMFSTGERLRPEQPDYHQRSDRREW